MYVWASWHKTFFFDLLSQTHATLESHTDARTMTCIRRDWQRGWYLQKRRLKFAFDDFDGLLNDAAPIHIQREDVHFAFHAPDRHITASRHVCASACRNTPSFTDEHGMVLVNVASERSMQGYHKVLAMAFRLRFLLSHPVATRWQQFPCRILQTKKRTRKKNSTNWCQSDRKKL